MFYLILLIGLVTPPDYPRIYYVGEGDDVIKFRATSPSSYLEYYSNEDSEWIVSDRWTELKLKQWHNVRRSNILKP